MVIRYEGPKGGPGMQEMLYPTASSRARAWARPARWSPTAASPAARPGCPSATSRRRPPSGGTIALVEDGDPIAIDIPRRSIELHVPEAELAARRERLWPAGGYRPRDRNRPVSEALQAYAAMATSASTGASRDLTQLSR